jgi:3-oxoacyl-[acyl-carrier protein] reductase
VTGNPATLGDGLRDRVALVTGARRGIGAAAARGLAARGAVVAINHLPQVEMEEEADRLVAAINAEGGRALAIPGDVSSSDSVDTMFSEVERSVGSVDILVCNAARVPERIEVAAMSEEEWDATIDVNLKGTFLCSRRAIPSMTEGKWGRIITVSSVTTELGMGPFAHYVASKAGIIGLTRSLAKELGRHGITVNSVMPGAIRTELEEERSPDPTRGLTRAEERQAIPGRVVADDLTGTFLFLASEHSSHMTGQVLVVDAGWVLR